MTIDLPEYDMPDLSSMISDVEAISTPEEVEQHCKAIQEAVKNNDFAALVELAKKGLSTAAKYLPLVL